LRIVGVCGMRDASALSAELALRRVPSTAHNFTPLRARARVGGCFSPLAGGRHVRRAVIGVRRNVMRVGLAHGTQGDDYGERCGLMAP